jgi:hypothetical protein
MSTPAGLKSLGGRAETICMSTVADKNGSVPAPAPAPSPSSDRPVRVDLSIVEAEALRAWLNKPAADGTIALDDEHVKTSAMRLGTALDLIEAIGTVRQELQDAGLAVDGLSDEQVAALGSRISRTGLHRLS